MVLHRASNLVEQLQTTAARAFFSPGSKCLHGLPRRVSHERLLGMRSLLGSRQGFIRHAAKQCTPLHSSSRRRIPFFDLSKAKPWGRVYSRPVCHVHSSVEGQQAFAERTRLCKAIDAYASTRKWLSKEQIGPKRPFQSL
jgi:hypothetical protein